MRSACLDEYQYAVVWHDDLFLFGGNGRVLVLAQGFFDLLLDFQQGGIQCRGLHFNFWKVRNMGGAAVCRECAKHRVRLGLVRTFFESGMAQCQCKMTVTIVFASRYLNTLYNLPAFRAMYGKTLAYRCRSMLLFLK